MTEQAISQAFLNLYGGDVAPTLFFCPGRVNLIGEHIDYNGGNVFPAALTLGTYAAVRKRNDNLIKANSLNVPGEVIFHSSDDLVFDEKDSWGNFPKGVVAFLHKEGFSIGGYEILYWGNLPDGAGLSSSAAIEVLTSYMLLEMENTLLIDRIWLARFCQRVENQFIGVNCGIMDMFAVANGIKNHAMLINCDSLEYANIPLELGDYSVVIMNTNKRRELADSKYNERRGECEQALEILRNFYLLSDLCSSDINAVNEHINDPILLKRARHVVTENQRVKDAVEVLKKKDLVAFGALLNASHKSLHEDYEVTGLELDTLVYSAQSQPACLGARMTGAGFGGCALALVKTADYDFFIESVGKEYQEKTGLKADFYLSQIGEGVHILNASNEN